MMIMLLLMAVCAQAQTPQQWRDSVSTLIEAIRLHPKNITLKLQKAEANINLQQWEYARDEYSDVLRLDEHNLAALYFRAFCHVQLNHLDMAKADYQQFLSISPRHFEANMGLAHVYQKLGRKADALETVPKPMPGVQPSRPSSSNTMWPSTTGMRPSACIPPRQATMSPRPMSICARAVGKKPAQPSTLPLPAAFLVPLCSTGTPAANDLCQESSTYAT